MKKIKSFIKDCVTDFKKVPSWMIALSVVAVVLMNIVASKGLATFGENLLSTNPEEVVKYLALDAGFLISWIMFLVMDVVTQKYGGKASFAVTIFDVGVALTMGLILLGIGQIPEIATDTFMSGWGWGPDSSFALNEIIGNSFLVVLVSLFAFIVSSGVDILSNVTIGKWMSNSKTFKGEDGKRSVKGFFIYFTRAYTSTFLSQLVDNIVFQFIAYNFLFAWFYDWNNAGVQPGALLGDGKVQLGLFIGALVGAVAELIMEFAFAPIGYLAISKKKKEQVEAQGA